MLPFTLERPGDRLLDNAHLKIPHNAGLFVLGYKLIKARAGNVLAQEPPDKQAGPGEAVYNFFLVAVAFPPKKGWITLSINLP